MTSPEQHISGSETVTTLDTPVEQLDYETARDQLVHIVRMLEHGGIGLEESLALWERGEALATWCEHHLAGARRRVEQVLSGDDGESSTASSVDSESGHEEGTRA